MSGSVVHLRRRVSGGLDLCKREDIDFGFVSIDANLVLVLERGDGEFDEGWRVCR